MENGEWRMENGSRFDGTGLVDAGRRRVGSRIRVSGVSTESMTNERAIKSSPPASFNGGRGDAREVGRGGRAGLCVRPWPNASARSCAQAGSTPSPAFGRSSPLLERCAWPVRAMLALVRSGGSVRSSFWPNASARSSAQTGSTPSPAFGRSSPRGGADQDSRFSAPLGTHTSGPDHARPIEADREAEASTPRRP